MKYLKLFEQVNQNSYQRIQYEEFEENVWDNENLNRSQNYCAEYWSLFSQKEINFICDYFGSSNFEIEYHSMIDGLPDFTPIKDADTSNVGNIDVSIKYLRKDGKTDYSDFVSIYKLNDEWLYVSIENEEYFKCDQLNGLSECLKNEINQ